MQACILKVLKIMYAHCFIVKVLLFIYMCKTTLHLEADCNEVTHWERLYIVVKGTLVFIVMFAITNISSKYSTNNNIQSVANANIDNCCKYW